MGVQLGFMGFNSVARVIGARLRARRELPAAAEAIAALSRGGRLVMRLPQPGPGTGRRTGSFLHRFRTSRARDASISNP